MIQTKTIYVSIHCLDRLQEMIATSDLFDRSRPLMVGVPKPQNDLVLECQFSGSEKSLKILETYNRGLADALHHVLPKVLSETFKFRCTI